MLTSSDSFSAGLETTMRPDGTGRGSCRREDLGTPWPMNLPRRPRFFRFFETFPLPWCLETVDCRPFADATLSPPTGGAAHNHRSTTRGNQRSLGIRLNKL